MQKEIASITCWSVRLQLFFTDDKVKKVQSNPRQFFLLVIVLHLAVNLLQHFILRFGLVQSTGNVLQKHI